MRVINIRVSEQSVQWCRVWGNAQIKRCKTETHRALTHTYTPSAAQQLSPSLRFNPTPPATIRIVATFY